MIYFIDRYAIGLYEESFKKAFSSTKPIAQEEVFVIIICQQLLHFDTSWILHHFIWASSGISLLHPALVSITLKCYITITFKIVALH